MQFMTLEIQQHGREQVNVDDLPDYDDSAYEEIIN